MGENEIEIETVSIDDVLKDYSMAYAGIDGYMKYAQFNPPVECTIEFKKTETPEETIERLNKIYKEEGIDALAEAMREEGLYITNIQYSFGDEQPFTENIAFIGKIGAMDDC